MPPQLSSSSSSSHPPHVSHLTPSPPTLTPKPRHNLPIITLTQKANRIMVLTKKKLMPILVFLLTIFSVIRLLKITITTSSSPPAVTLLHTLQAACSSTSPACPDINITPQKVSSSNSTTLTAKEFKFLSKIISRRAPCNLLVFGIQNQYLSLQSINVGGTTIFLEDNPDNLRAVESKYNNTLTYRVKYKDRAKDGYKLLKHARENPDCLPRSNLQEVSRCKLALEGLPKEVNGLTWDVVVVDGPSGDGPEAPGRMAAIYTASIIARRGNATEVVVHDVDRTIEKWFSWEFLCENNLVSSKGKFWNFRIRQQSNSTSFCIEN